MCTQLVLRTAMQIRRCQCAVVPLEKPLQWWGKEPWKSGTEPGRHFQRRSSSHATGFKVLCGAVPQFRVAPTDSLCVCDAMHPISIFHLPPIPPFEETRSVDD